MAVHLLKTPVEALCATRNDTKLELKPLTLGLPVGHFTNWAIVKSGFQKNKDNWLVDNMMTRWKHSKCQGELFSLNLTVCTSLNKKVYLLMWMSMDEKKIKSTVANRVNNGNHKSGHDSSISSSYIRPLIPPRP